MAVTNNVSNRAPKRKTYKEMITEALINLKESRGSTRQSLKKYLEANFHLPPNNITFKAFNAAVNAGVEDDYFIEKKHLGPIKLRSGKTSISKLKTPEKKNRSASRRVASAQAKVTAPTSKKVIPKKALPASKTAALSKVSSTSKRRAPLARNSHHLRASTVRNSTLKRSLPTSKTAYSAKKLTTPSRVSTRNRDTKQKKPLIVSNVKNKPLAVSNNKKAAAKSVPEVKGSSKAKLATSIGARKNSKKTAQSVRNASANSETKASGKTGVVKKENLEKSSGKTARKTSPKATIPAKKTTLVNPKAAAKVAMSNNKRSKAAPKVAAPPKNSKNRTSTRKLTSTKK
ncbi:hypothetical protein HDU92_005221 [Lobulomyces angularis]|nr:hypothetical protein HDU92_005221 [Lobulomyces angularis]